MWRGAVLALLASALFGLSTPLVQHFGRGLGPFATAGLLYAGAALLGAVLRQPVEREAQLQRGDAPRLLLMQLHGYLHDSDPDSFRFPEQEHRHIHEDMDVEKTVDPSRNTL